MHSPEHEELCLLYDSGELAAPDRSSFERTLADCRDCRVFLASVKACHRLAEGASTGPGRDLDNRVLAGTAGQAMGARPAGPLLRPTTAVAALALAAALALFLVRPAPEARDLEWSGGVDDHFAAAGEELEDIALSLGQGLDASDIDRDLEELESSAGQIKDQG